MSSMAYPIFLLLSDGNTHRCTQWYHGRMARYGVGCYRARPCQTITVTTTHQNPICAAAPTHKTRCVTISCLPKVTLAVRSTSSAQNVWAACANHSCSGYEIKCQFGSDYDTGSFGTLKYSYPATGRNPVITRSSIIMYYQQTASSIRDYVAPPQSLVARYWQEAGGTYRQAKCAGQLHQCEHVPARGRR
jgi:hypothetical protein